MWFNEIQHFNAIEAWKKSQMTFSTTVFVEIMFFDTTFTEIYSLGSHVEKIATGQVNGVKSNRWQAIPWFNVDPDYRRHMASYGSVAEFSIACIITLTMAKFFLASWGTALFIHLLLTWTDFNPIIKSIHNPSELWRKSFEVKGPLSLLDTLFPEKYTLGSYGVAFRCG